MPRRPRVHLDGVHLHIVQRGHNREPCFFGEDSGSSASLEAYTRVPSMIVGAAAVGASVIPAARAVKMCYESAKAVKDPCRTAILAAALGAGICKGDPADDFINDMKNREEIRRGSELAGQKKIGNQQQYP